MATRMGQICRNIRWCANKFSFPPKASCGERFSMGARYYARVPRSQIQDLHLSETSRKAFRTVLSLSGYAFFVWWTYSNMCFKHRKRYADWKAEKKVQKRLEKLESKKHESAEAYLEVLEREFNALKADLLDRPADMWKEMGLLKRKADILKIRISLREIEALREEVNSCRNIGGYANKFLLPSSARVRVGARSYSSGGGLEPGISLCFCICPLFAWVLDGFVLRERRARREDYIANGHRDHFEYAKGHLEELERKIDAIKAKQRERANGERVPKEASAKTVA